LHIIPHFSAHDDARPTTQLPGPAEDFFSGDQSLCVPAEKRGPYINQTAFVVLSLLLDLSKKEQLAAQK